MSTCDEQRDGGDRVDGSCGAPSSAPGRLKTAEAKLEWAQEELGEAEREERKTLRDIREAEAEVQNEHRLIHFSVDGEDYETEQRKWTPNNILRQFPKLDPATYYLVQLTGKQPISYKGKGDIPIELHECEAFQAKSDGPTPVSDGRVRIGVDAFLDGLRELGIEPSQDANVRDRVVIDYVVPVGILKGKTMMLGFIVPSDFPMTPPSGPHVSPIIHQNQSGGVHPTGGVHDSAFGSGWQYWSRPYPEWPKSRRNAAAYMGHIFRLWATQ